MARVATNLTLSVQSASLNRCVAGLKVNMPFYSSFSSLSSTSTEIVTPKLACPQNQKPIDPLKFSNPCSSICAISTLLSLSYSFLDSVIATTLSFLAYLKVNPVTYPCTLNYCGSNCIFFKLFVDIVYIRSLNLTQSFSG